MKKLYFTSQLSLLPGCCFKYPFYLLVNKEVILLVAGLQSSVDGSELKLGCVNLSDTLQTGPFISAFYQKRVTYTELGESRINKYRFTLQPDLSASYA